MPDYRRYFVPGGTYFFTVVTARRAPLFQHARARQLLGEAMRDQRAKTPFSTVAIVLLPDHLHAIWTLPAGDANYSLRWQAIKAYFSHRWLALGGPETSVSKGYGAQRRRGVWQARFIEHTIRDESDLNAHADYIHYNPVKHQLVRNPRDWPWSSFHRFVALGHYAADWGRSDSDPPPLDRVDGGLLD